MALTELVLATRHAKDRALARVFAAIGFRIVVPPDLDTDSLGAFAGGPARTLPPAEAALEKTKLGLAAYRARYALASEGGFGPHPALPFAAAGEEWLVLFDAETGRVARHRRLSARTNFASRDARFGDDLAPFLARARFPSHALVATSPEGTVEKGIVERATLESLLARRGALRLETDMRAHLNPTRMREIRSAGLEFARRLATPCPACAAPGFGRIGARPGLRCEACGAATPMVAAEIHGCAVCGHREERPRADGLVSAPSLHCPECNP